MVGLAEQAGVEFVQGLGEFGVLMGEADEAVAVLLPGPYFQRLACLAGLVAAAGALQVGQRVALDLFIEDFLILVGIPQGFQGSAGAPEQPKTDQYGHAQQGCCQLPVQQRGGDNDVFTGGHGGGGRGGNEALAAHHVQLDGIKLGLA